MNVRGIASGLTAAVNPPTSVTVEQSTGYTTSGDGTRVPTYTTISTTGSVQALTGRDLEKLSGLNIQGVTQKIYLNGNFEGVFRATGRGGDLLKFGGQTYLVAAVLERWPDWCCLAITMQMDGP